MTAQTAAWVGMWLLAFAIFISLKTLAWAHAAKEFPRSRRNHLVQFMFLWVGMDAKPFLIGPAQIPRPHFGEWLLAAAKTIFGVILFCGVARRFEQREMICGWIGLIGLVFMLHFGFFHLLALWWRNRGIDVKPIMRAPLLSQSLGEFWGSRWNRAFSQLAHDFLFVPLKKPLGVAVVTLFIFLVSGLLHDAVLSIPSRGGYGWPTLYFLIQGFATLFERSSMGKRIGLSRGVRGRLFTILVTIVPVSLLYHPIFMHNVAVPMLKSLGAIQGNL